MGASRAVVLTPPPSQISNASTISPISQTRDVPFADVVHTDPLARTLLTLITMKSPGLLLDRGYRPSL
jgi:hypothetical protein